MKLRIKDYNSANDTISQNFQQEWIELSSVLESMPLHLKASDQRNKVGAPIFDPKGTNQHIEANLIKKQWERKIPIPQDLKEALGIDLDFGKKGLLTEVQFSNYPFLLNNVIRSEVLYQRKFQIGGIPLKLALIITKAHMFPSSNSSLYFEQAVKQIDLVESLGIFEMPIRLIGLFENYDEVVQTHWTTYSAKRYSRTVDQRNAVKSVITQENKIRLIEETIPP